ncbi:STAS domain-containing protein [Mycolicibacterium sp. CBM1]
MTCSNPSTPVTGRAGPRNLDSTDQSANRLQLFTEWCNSTDVRITAVGHIDMSTAHRFSDYVFRRAGNCRQLTLDLSQVSFFDCAAFSALCHIDDRCHMAEVAWTVHPSDCVSRVVEICDPLDRLPLSTTAEAA